MNRRVAAATLLWCQAQCGSTSVIWTDPEPRPGHEEVFIVTLGKGGDDAGRDRVPQARVFCVLCVNQETLKTHTEGEVK